MFRDTIQFNTICFLCVSKVCPELAVRTLPGVPTYVKQILELVLFLSYQISLCNTISGRRDLTPMFPISESVCACPLIGYTKCNSWNISH